MACDCICFIGMTSGECNKNVKKSTWPKCVGIHLRLYLLYFHSLFIYELWIIYLFIYHSLLHIFISHLALTTQMSPEHLSLHSPTTPFPSLLFPSWRDCRPTGPALLVAPWTVEKAADWWNRKDRWCFFSFDWTNTWHVTLPLFMSIQKVYGKISQNSCSLNCLRMGVTDRTGSGITKWKEHVMLWFPPVERMSGFCHRHRLCRPKVVSLWIVSLREIPQNWAHVTDPWMALGINNFSMKAKHRPANAKDRWDFGQSCGSKFDAQPSLGIFHPFLSSVFNRVFSK